MQNLIETLRRPSTSNQNSFNFGSNQNRQIQMKSLMNISEIISNLSNNNTMRGKPNLDKFHQSYFQCESGLLTGGRQGKLVNLKYSRALNEKYAPQFINKTKDSRSQLKDLKYKNISNKFHKSQMNVKQNQIVRNQYGYQDRRSYVNAQDMNSLNSFQSQNFQSRLMPKKNTNSIFPETQLEKRKAYKQMQKDLQNLKFHKNFKNQQHQKAIRREKKFKTEEKKSERNYQDEGTEQSNIHTTFENYMNQIQGINNQDLGEPPSFIDMQNAQVFNAKTPFFELDSNDKLVSQKAHNAKKSKGSESKGTNYNQSKFSDLNDCLSKDQDNNQSPDIIKKKQRFNKSAKASKRYVDDKIPNQTDANNDQRQQMKSGLMRIANQTLHLNNNTNNNQILSDTFETNMNAFSNQNDTIDYYEKTIHKLLRKDLSISKKQNPLPPIDKLKQAAIDTNTSQNAYNFKKPKIKGQNAGNISAVSPRENLNSTRTRIFAKEQQLLSPLNNKQYEPTFDQNMATQEREQSKQQLQLSKIEKVLQTARSSNQDFLIKKGRRGSSSSNQSKILSNPIIRLHKKLSNAVNMNQQAIAKNLATSPKSGLDNYGIE